MIKWIIGIGALVFTYLLLERREEAFGPGDWFQAYAKDWMEAFDARSLDEVTSGFVTGGETGDLLWATATPEWDLEWFESRGMEFPEKWVQYKHLSTASSKSGPVTLPGL